MAYQDHIETVPGKQTKDILIYSLSTCFWCDKAKEFLGKLGVSYRFLVVDQLEEKDQAEALDEVVKYNPDASFPTIVIHNGKKVMIGYDEEGLKELANE